MSEIFHVLLNVIISLCLLFFLLRVFKGSANKIVSNSFSRIIIFPKGKVSIEEIKDLLGQEGFKFIEESSDSRMIKFKSNASFFSWGEVVSLCVKEGANEKAEEVEVSSHSTLKTTVSDWGKNKENVEKIAKLLEGKCS